MSTPTARNHTKVVESRGPSPNEFWEFPTTYVLGSHGDSIDKEDDKL